MQDSDNYQAESQSGGDPYSEIPNENFNELGESTSDEVKLQNFLKLKEHGQSSRTRALRLKENDVVVAIDGISYHDSIDNMVDLLSSGEESDMWLLKSRTRN